MRRSRNGPRRGWRIEEIACRTKQNPSSWRYSRASLRTALLEFQASGELDVAGIERVFARFVEAKWGEAMADDKFTHHESLVLRRILEELQLPERAIPLQLRLALRNA